MKTQPWKTKAKLLFSLTLSLLFYNSIAQNHYIKSASVAGIEVRQGGGENSICPTYSSHFSTNNTADKFYFTSMICQAAYVKLEIFNPTSGTIKATLTTTYGVGVETKTIAAGSSSGILVIPYDASYNWKFESVATLPQFIADTLRTVAGANKYVFPRVNDIAIPANTNYRVKAGQTLTLGTLTADNSDYSFLFRPSSVGTQTIILELYNASTNVVLGESNLNIVVTQNCALGITSITRIDSKNYDVAITYNSFVEPYKWELYNSAGLKVKTGTTVLSGDPGLKRIFIDDIASGIYDFRLSSLNSNCGVVSKQFSYGNSADVCTMNASAVRVGNYYNVTIAPITGVAGVYYTLTNALDSVITEGIVNSGVALNLNFTGKAEGQYFLSLNPANSNKICYQKLSLTWVVAQTINNRGYLKKYNNVSDYFEIAGVGDYTGTKDAGTGWVLKESKTSLTWKTYIKGLSNVPGAKAILTLREDSSSSSRHISIAIENDRIKVIQRTTKNGSNTVTTEITGKTGSRWAQIRRVGNTAILEESDGPADSDNQTYSPIATLTNVFSTWKPIYYKGIYVSSGSSTNLVSAEFHRFLGGPYTGTSATVDNTPLSAPIIASSNLNPTANASVSFSASVCKSGFLIQYYKNGLPIYQGANYTVTVTYGDAYKAKCEKGTEKSAFSNTITFTAPSTSEICGITDGLKIGTKTRGGIAYELFARIFSGKLWLTQSLGTTPESFLVRGINITTNDPNSPDFVKSWTGTDYSCFEGQSTGYGGNVEPTGFTTPTGYTLSTTSDGAKIYTLGSVVSDGSGGTTVASGVIFPNMFSSIALETGTDTFGAEKFMNLTYPSGLVRGTFPKTYNADLDMNIPNWVNVLWTDLSMVYKNKGYNVIDDFGYLGSVDIRKHGTLNTDWANFPWGSFVTALPVERRVEAYLGDMVYDFLALDDAGVIQRGRGIANNTDFGNIIVGGKTQRAFTGFDSEGAGEDGSDGIHRPLLLCKTIFENTRGIVAYMYGTPIRSDLGYSTNGFGYPDANGNLPTEDINPIFRDSESFNGVSYKLVNSKGLAPLGEISHYGESAYGNYNDGVRQLTVFGPNANNEHYLARVVEHNEKNYYAYKKLGGSDLMMFQNKSICDRGANGWKYTDGTRQNGGAKTGFTGYLKRDQVFKSQMASFFSGVHTVEWNRPPTGLNSDSQNGIEEARTILNTEVIFSPTEKVSAIKLRTGAFEFSLWNAEYRLQGETNWRKEKGYQLKDTQDNLLVRFMKKGNYMVVYICDPYNLATKKNLTVRWGSFEKSYSPADWASCYADGSTKDYVFAIYNLSTTVVQTGSISAPTITKDIANPTAGQSVILTSSGCQSSSFATKWYDNSEGNLLSASLTYTVSAQNASSYYAKCVGTSGSSAASNVITFSITPPSSTGVTITEPALAYNSNGTPTYYFSDLHAPAWYDGNAHLPAIFTNSSGYNAVNDLVWMRNDKIKIAINLKRGGQIAWASLIDDTSNLVYNGYDGGFQIQLDAYQKKDGYEQNGKYSRAQYSDVYQYSNSTTSPAPNNLASYNVTQGGDFNNHAVSLYEYKKVGTNGYYIKMRPNFYTINSELSKTFIEATYTLEGYAVKCDYKYTSYRDDTQFDGSGFDAGHAPVCFLVNNLTNYKSYTGNSPWTHDTPEDNTLPNESTGGTPLTKVSKERWSLVYNPDNSKTIGVYSNSTANEESFSLKQKEVYGSRTGSEFTGGYTILGRNYDLVPFLSTFDRSNFSKTISSYLIVAPNPSTFIDKVYEIAGH